MSEEKKDDNPKPKELEKVEGGKYTGTFKFNAVDEDSGAVVTFSNGVFYKL